DDAVPSNSALCGTGGVGEAPARHARERALDGQPRRRVGDDAADAGARRQPRSPGSARPGPGVAGVPPRSPRPVHPDSRPVRPRPARRTAGERSRHRAPRPVIRQAAYRRRWRPTRYLLAAMIGAALFLVLVLSSVASFAIGPVPLRATLFGLP